MFSHRMASGLFFDCQAGTPMQTRHTHLVVIRGQDLLHGGLLAQNEDEVEAVGRGGFELLGPADVGNHLHMHVGQALVAQVGVQDCC